MFFESKCTLYIKHTNGPLNAKLLYLYKSFYRPTDLPELTQTVLSQAVFQKRFGMRAFPCKIWAITSCRLLNISAPKSTLIHLGTFWQQNIWWISTNAAGSLANLNDYLQELFSVLHMFVSSKTLPPCLPSESATFSQNSCDILMSHNSRLMIVPGEQAELSNCYAIFPFQQRLLPSHGEKFRVFALL